jgi:hypothetical protein
MVAPSLAKFVQGQGTVGADYLNGLEQTCDNFNQLRGFTGTAGMQVYVRGKATPNDYGQGDFYWSSGALGPDDNSNTIMPYGSVSGGWVRVSGGAQQSYPVNFKFYGALSGGLSDNSAAVAAANLADLPISITQGSYYFSQSVTFSVPVYIQAEATLSILISNTITFSEGLYAGIYPIFAPGTSVSISPQFTLRGYPEWWGAVSYPATAYPVGSPTFSDAAIQSAINSGLPLVQLAGGDYYINAAISLQNHNQVFAGVASNQNSNPTPNAHVGASRIVINSPSIDGVVVGPSAVPSGGPTQNWLEHVTVKNMTIIRSVIPTPITNSSPGFIDGFQTSPTGLRSRFTVHCYFIDVICIDHSVGIYIRGNVFNFFQNCESIRTKLASGVSFDFHMGFFQDSSDNYGYANGNASLYITYCASFGSSVVFPIFSAGYYSASGFTDTFIHGFEAGNLNYGMNMNGRTASDLSAHAEDLKITACVLDACSTAAILINGGNRNQQVIIANGYIQSPVMGIQINSNNGQTCIMGNQLIGGAPGSTGILLNGTGLSTVVNGVSSEGNIITDCAYPVVFNYAAASKTSDNINNNNVALTYGVWVQNGSYRNIIQPLLHRGGGTPSGVGIQVDTAANNNLTDPSGIDPGALTAGAATNKLIYGATSITTVGTYGSGNYATGVMG